MTSFDFYSQAVEANFQRRDQIKIEPAVEVVLLPYTNV